MSVIFPLLCIDINTFFFIYNKYNCKEMPPFVKLKIGDLTG